MWYALHVRSRHEKLVALLLGQKGFETFLPLYQVKHRWATARRNSELPLFPCYVFCRFDLQQRTKVISTQGVVSIVGAGSVPIPLDEKELDAVRAVVASGRDAERCEYLQVGSRVTIERGPLAGVEGVLVVAKNCRKFVVQISLLRRSVSVQVDADDLDWAPPTGARTVVGSTK